jgi:uncharacterized membrane protein
LVLQGAERAERPRIQRLSDLIFGLALSISALTLVGRQPNTSEELGFFLGLYGFSFLILISVWRVYSSVSSILPSETPVLADLNIVLLFFVSIEPYLFNELFALQGTMLLSASGLYSLDLAGMFFIIAFFDHSLAKEELHLVPREMLRRYRSDRNFTLFVASLFAISVLPYFGETTVFTSVAGSTTYQFTMRSSLWLLGLFISWGRRAVMAVRSRKSGNVVHEADQGD